MVSASTLDKFINESIEQPISSSHYPTIFIQMRKPWAKEAIKRLVNGSDIQGSAIKLKEMDMLDWTIVAAFLKSPTECDQGAHAAAKFRLIRAKAI